MSITSKSFLLLIVTVVLANEALVLAAQNKGNLRGTIITRKYRISQDSHRSLQTEVPSSSGSDSITNSLKEAELEDEDEISNEPTSTVTESETDEIVSGEENNVATDEPSSENAEDEPSNETTEEPTSSDTDNKGNSGDYDITSAPTPVTNSENKPTTAPTTGSSSTMSDTRTRWYGDNEDENNASVEPISIVTESETDEVVNGGGDIVLTNEPSSSSSEKLENAKDEDFAEGTEDPSSSNTLDKDDSINNDTMSDPQLQDSTPNINVENEKTAGPTSESSSMMSDTQTKLNGDNEEEDNTVIITDMGNSTEAPTSSTGAPTLASSSLGPSPSPSVVDVDNNNNDNDNDENISVKTEAPSTESSSSNSISSSSMDSVFSNLTEAPTTESSSSNNVMNDYDGDNYTMSNTTEAPTSESSSSNSFSASLTASDNDDSVTLETPVTRPISNLFSVRPATPVIRPQFVSSDDDDDVDDNDDDDDDVGDDFDNDNDDSIIKNDDDDDDDDSVRPERPVTNPISNPAPERPPNTNPVFDDEDDDDSVNNNVTVAEQFPQNNNWPQQQPQQPNQDLPNNDVMNDVTEDTNNDPIDPDMLHVSNHPWIGQNIVRPSDSVLTDSIDDDGDYDGIKRLRGNN